MVIVAFHSSNPYCSKDIRILFLLLSKNYFIINGCNRINELTRITLMLCSKAILFSHGDGTN